MREGERQNDSVFLVCSCTIIIYVLSTSPLEKSLQENFLLMTEKEFHSVPPGVWPADESETL